jgi:hypothetical protein
VISTDTDPIAVAKALAEPFPVSQLRLIERVRPRVNSVAPQHVRCGATEAGEGDRTG